MRRGALLFAWLLAGHAVAAACYALLITLSDANVLLLALSAVSLLAGVSFWAVTDATAVAWLVPGTSFRNAWRLGVRRGLPAFVLAAGVLLCAWWVADRAHAWYRGHQSELDAWIMVTFDTNRTHWIHRGVTALAWALRAIVAVSLAASLLAAVVIGGVREALSPRWVAHALSRFQLGVVAAVMVLLVNLPWRAASWRPRGLPPTWLEAGFVGLKLSVLIGLTHLAWVVVLFAAQQTYGRSRQVRPDSSARVTHADDRS
jgi:hypothetical protein